MNNNLILISGKSATGKSMSLRNLTPAKGVIYLNCENNKSLPFKNSKDFKQGTIIDPLNVYRSFLKAENMDDIHTIVVDSLGFLMDMYENVYVSTATNTLQAWGEYAKYFKKLMQQYVAASTKRIVFTAHTVDVLNETEMINETMVKVKGSIMNTGIESYFSNVISTKKMTVAKLEKYSNPLLNITDAEKELGFKYVFQTGLTKETINERIRAPLFMWEKEETFIDNDVNLVFNRLAEYYK